MKKTKDTGYRELLASATGTDSRFYSAIVLVCGFIFAIGLCFVLKPGFEYHSDLDIVSWISVNKYPKQQEMFYYAASLFFVPLFTAIIWGSWLFCSSMLSFLTGLPLHQTLKRGAIPYLPFVLVLRHIQTPTFSNTLLMPLILVFAIKSIIIVHALSQTRFQQAREIVFHPGSWNTHWSVFTSGICAGFFALIGYGNSEMSILSCLAVVLAAAGSVWLFWLLYSRVLSAIIKRPFGDILAGDVCSYFPLAILLLLSLFYNHRDAVLIISLIPAAALKIVFIIRQDWFKSIRLHKHILDYVLLPGLIYVFFYSGGNIHGGIDMFHEGERLAPLNSLLRGKIPYRDIYLQHGLFHNAYRPLLAAKLFGPTLAADRMLEHILDPLRNIAFYFLGLQVFRSRFFALLSILVIASGKNYDLSRRAMSARYALGVASMAILLNYTFTRRRRLFYRFHLRPVLAGILAVLCVFYSVEMGLYSLLTGVLFLLAFCCAPGQGIRERFRPLLSYSLGAFIAFVPFLLYFSIYGAVDDLFINFFRQCRYQIPTWGLRFPPLFAELSKAGSLEGLKAFILGNTFKWYFPVFIYLVTLTHLMHQLFRGGFWTRRYNPILLLLVISGIIFFRTPLGRSDDWHLYGISFAWFICVLLAEALTLKAWGELKAGSELFPTAAWRVFLVVLLAWYVQSLHNPVDKAKEWMLTLTRYESIERNVKPVLERAGGIKIPEDQAAQIKAMVEYIQNNTAPDETIFDFSSQGAYYFFADRPMASRYHSVCYTVTGDMQREVIRDLEKHGTKLVIFMENREFDGINSVDRYPLIAEYLREKYVESTKIGGITILKRITAEDR